MKPIYKLLLIFSLFAAFASCNGYDEYSGPQSTSGRDGEYFGERLKFTIDGKPQSVESVSFESWYVDSEPIPSDDTTLLYPPRKTTYAAIVTIKGFPGKKDKVTIHTISDGCDIKGYTTIGGSNRYSCIGHFYIISPDLPTDQQGLELQLISE